MGALFSSETICLFVSSYSQGVEYWINSDPQRDDLKMKSISVTAANQVEVITAKLTDVVVHSVYKSPSEQFVIPPLGHRSLP